MNKLISLNSLKIFLAYIRSWLQPMFDAIESNQEQQQESINNIEAKFLDYAPLDSPELTGTPTAPTADTETSDTQLATTQFVQQEIDRRAKELEVTVAETDITLDKIEAATSILQEGGNPMYRLRDADGNIIAPVTLTTHVIDPETKKSLPLLIKEAAHVVLISEANWETIEASKTAYDAFCQKYDGWYLATYEDESELPQFSESVIDDAGNLTLDGTIDADGNLTLNATITENGTLTL